MSCMDQNKNAEHETASWASVIMRYQESYGLWIIIAEIFSGWEAFFWASENYTRWVDFECHFLKSQLLSKFSLYLTLVM